MFTVDEILKVTGGKLVSCAPSRLIRGVSIDSRTITRGELFVAIKGDNYDGHNFIEEAQDKGAAAALVSRIRQFQASAVKIRTVIQVFDTVKALGEIANFYRTRFNIPVIGITGSNGKTTTKDMIASVLGMKLRVLKNSGSLNNFIGLPMTLLKLNGLHQVCVLEMGANRPGEIRRLAQIAAPNTGIVTNVGPSHLKFFNDLETVARAKTELFEGFKENMTAVWNADDAMLAGLYQLLRCRKRTFGTSRGADVQAVRIRHEDNSWNILLNTGELIRLSLLGRHNIVNALAAVAVGHIFDVSSQDIYDALADFKAPSMRMQKLDVAGITIINDCYNSNPKSMESAVAALSEFNTAGRRILVTADMLELGPVSSYYHHQLGRAVAASPIDILITVGELSKEAASAAVEAGMNPDSVWHCNTQQDAGSLLLQTLQSGDVVLIKGSRAMKMEKVCSVVYSVH